MSFSSKSPSRLCGRVEPQRGEGSKASWQPAGSRFSGRRPSLCPRFVRFVSFVVALTEFSVNSVPLCFNSTAQKRPLTLTPSPFPLRPLMAKGVRVLAIFIALLLLGTTTAIADDAVEVPATAETPATAEVPATAETPAAEPAPAAESISAAAEPPAPAPPETPEPTTEPPAPPQYAVYPPEIQLDSARDFQSFVAVLTRPDGVTVDISDRVTWRIDGGEIAKIDQFTVHPLVDGEATLVAEFEGVTQTIPLRVHNAAVKPAISFEQDVMPVLTRAGCNTGACHGAARGKDGFGLSLFGFDPQGDYVRVTREIGFRRINLAVPEDSLLLKKSVGAVAHSGGKRFDVDSDYYATILEWLQAGAPADAQRPPVAESVAVYPAQVVLEGDGATQRFVAVATYSDGTTRDLSRLAGFSSNNPITADISDAGSVTAGTRGEAFVMARFDTHTVGSQVLVLPENLQYTAPESTGNYIDELVDKKLRQVRIPPSGLCTDEEFLRRVTIDITGLLPTPEEYQAFLANESENKRAELVDQLLERKEFSEIWAMKFAQLLAIKSANDVSYKSAFLYANWLTDQFVRNVPIDAMVRDLLASTGGTFTTPQTNFYEMERDRLKTAENVAQVFMGIRTQCAQCHNHPFDRWTMDDYYGFAAFFAQVGRKQAEDYREFVIYPGGGETKHPVSGQNMKPKFLGGDVPDVAGKDRREVLAQWLTAGDNPYFATSIANRVWAHFSGVGLVDEVDDIRASNPPSNPELFERLGEKLVEYNFDFRQLVRDICASQAYQRSSQALPENETDTRNYSHAVVRRLPAESLLDCISQVTAVPDKFRGLPLGARAVQIADGATSNYFLTSFGRSPRATVADCEASTDPSLSQALHLLNGNSVHNKINQGKLVAKWLNEDKLSVDEVLQTIYIRCLTRIPTDTEMEELRQMVAASKNEQQGLEDVFWAVLNSREFVFNH